MVRVYIVRHCEAAGNKKRIFQGSTDCGITELGQKQLEFLRERFSKIEVDKVYSSDLKRAFLTAKVVADEKTLPVIIEPGLTEFHGGIIEGMPFKEIFENHRELEYAWEFEPQNFAPENGETMRKVYERVWVALSRIVKENEGKTVLIASHGAAIRNIMCRLCFGDIERLKEVPWSDNTAVSYIEFESDGTHKIIFANDTSHLPAEYLPHSNRITAYIPKGKK